MVFVLKQLFLANTQKIFPLLACSPNTLNQWNCRKCISAILLHFLFAYGTNFRDTVGYQKVGTSSVKNFHNVVEASRNYILNFFTKRQEKIMKTFNSQSISTILIFRIFQKYSSCYTVPLKKKRKNTITIPNLFILPKMDLKEKMKISFYCLFNVSRSHMKGLRNVLFCLCLEKL
jgi:hypothetical protein